MESGRARPWLELLCSLLVGGYLLAVVVLTWNHPLVTTVLLALSLGVQGRCWYRPEYGRAMVIAALLGTPAEVAEVWLGEWTYHGPQLIWGIPMWIPLIWSNLFALFHRLAGALYQLLQRWRVTGSGGRMGWAILFALLWLIIVLVMVTGLATIAQPWYVVALYGFFFLSMLVFWNGPGYVLIFLLGGLLGTVGEFICVQLGYWHYFNPYYVQWGVSWTLPLDWGLSAVIISRLSGFWRQEGARWKLEQG